MDEQLLAYAKEHAHAGTLAEAEAREGFGPFRLTDIAGGHALEGPGHFGQTTRLFWSFIYELFVGANTVVAHPPGFPAKSVLAADVYEKPIGWGGVAYIGVWASGRTGPGPPVLVPFPTVPDVLMQPNERTSFGDSCRAYRNLIDETVA